MAEPSCKTCKHFDAAMRGNGGECLDKTKRIYPRRSMPSEVNPPWIDDGEIYTCANHTPRDESPNGEVSDAGPLTSELKPKCEPGIR